MELDEKFALHQCYPPAARAGGCQSLVPATRGRAAGPNPKMSEETLVEVGRSKMGVATPIHSVTGPCSAAP